MYLMNVPPVAAIHSEWRSSCGGPPRGFSGLPLCFNDSDSDLSTTGTPIPEKVQMIIESLRSTQSSLDMGQPGQEAGARSSQGQGFKARRGPPLVTGPSSKFRGPPPPTHSDILLALPEVSSNVDSESPSADSDDSSDGIEEAIQEYLKEKDDHKRKAEPEAAGNVLQPPKTPRREAPLAVPEPPKQHSDSNKVLTASNQVPRSVKTYTQNTVPPTMKKHVKSKTPTCKENPFKKMDTSKAVVVKKLASFEKKRGPSNVYLLSDKLKGPVLNSKSEKSMKLEEHLSDSDSSSSSDDGIEEAIQRYQQEKRKDRHEGGGRQSTKPLRHLKEEADSSSSSDDGIEEAIRRYQLEKQKEKSVTKLSLSLPKQKQVSRGATAQHCPENANNQEIRKFLEQKAQMHKQSPGTDSAVGTSPDGTNIVTEPKKHPKLSPAQKKTIRLSLTQKRKRKEEDNGRKVSNEEGETDLKMKEADPKPSTEHDGLSSLSASCLKNTPQLARASERRREQTGDKSSSLDSDEDLDTAIKDLLKTKKKLKKKTRDKKPPSALRSLKTEPKPISLLKTSLKVTPTSPSTESRNDKKKKGRISKNVSSHPQSNKKKESLNQANETDRAEVNRDVEGLSTEGSPVVVQIKEDSSSVDSDDSIEQEIRKFLAEKAKVSTSAVKTADGQDVGNGSGKTTVPVMERCIKSENQLAEISRMDVTQFSEPPRQTSPEQRRILGRGVFPNTTPANQGNPTTPDTARGSCLVLPLTPSSYPPAMEPTNGTGSGAARAEKRRRSSSGSGSSDAHQSASSEMARGHDHKSFPSPGTSLPRTDSEQSKGQAIPTTQTKEKIHKRNPFQYSSPSLGEKTARTPAYQCGVPTGLFDHRRSAETASRADTPVSTCPPVRTGRSLRTPLVPFHRPSSFETTSTSAAVFSSPFPSLTRRPTATGPSGRYFLHGHASGSGHRWGSSPTLAPGLAESSVVHVAKDRTTYVELSTNKTNHVQVRSREEKGSEGKEDRRRDLAAGERGRESERERGSRMTEERGGEQIGRREEECVDETDISESDERTSPEKKQGFPSL
uniref:Protein phosphatase 1 regulatory subunit 26 N-terminal domain-containing protein n=1 Tax=Esox lucius TaxID=8010 RepID=A0A3P8ZFB1_ESOLU